MIQLGCKAKDIISGFEGICIGRTLWLHGCTTYGLQPPSKDGALKDVAWFDEGRVVVLAETIQTHTENHKDPGGPQITPKRTLAGM